MSLLLKLNRYQMMNLKNYLSTEYCLEINWEAKTCSKPPIELREFFPRFFPIFSENTALQLIFEKKLQGFSVETESFYKN